MPGWAGRLRATPTHLWPALAGLRDDRGTWIGDGLVLATARPRRRSSLAGLADRGIRTVINLTDRRHPPRDLTDVGLVEVFVPVPDFRAPSPEQVATVVAVLDEAAASGQPVAVHRGAGLGRTGTVVSCYLVAGGRTADEAIAEVRRRRPGSIETPEQVRAIHRFAAAAQGPGGRDEGQPS